MKINFFKLSCSCFFSIAYLLGGTGCKTTQESELSELPAPIYRPEIYTDLEECSCLKINYQSKKTINARNLTSDCKNIKIAKTFTDIEGCLEMVRAIENQENGGFAAVNIVTVSCTKITDLNQACGENF